MRSTKKPVNRYDQTDDHRKEIIRICLQQFVDKGLYETTSRDLSRALDLQSGGIYYYFRTKDDVVLACAEEASILLEDSMIQPALDCLYNPDLMVTQILDQASEMAPIMKFFTQVCTMKKYRPHMQPALDRMGQRHTQYCQRFAERLNRSIEEVAPYVCMCITAVTDYMIFGEALYPVPQFELIKQVLHERQNPA